MTPKVKASWLSRVLPEVSAAVAGWDARRPSARTAAAVVILMLLEGMGVVLILLVVTACGR
jgi:type IV secretory pathway TrbF-like protein